MMLNHEGKGESEDNDKNDEDVFQYLGYDVVEHDAKLSVWHPIKFEDPFSSFIIMNSNIIFIHRPCDEPNPTG